MAEISSLGRYQLRRVLGRGAMGVVYEGFDPALSRQVAVKTILKSVALDAETERTYAARFTLEAKAVARLNHPNIVQVYDFGVEGEVAYLVMEFIAGQELRAAFDANEKFELADVVRIMGELLDALDFAHERGVIHRDVKPANVMLDARRRVKLADFGVARLQEGERATVGTMVGTPAFMSPEQIKGQKIDRRTDVFSAGTILYQLLTGEQPFKGDGVWTVAKKIIEEDPPAPSAVMVSVSPAFDEVVYQALAKEPSERFASARDFSAALRAAGVGTAIAGVARPSAAKPRTKPEIKASETELEFWRSIQNRDDLDELELFLEQFPEGAYAQLARLKVAKLRAPLEAARAAEAKARQEAEEQARGQAEEQARREAEARAKREAEEKAEREAEERARQVAEEKAKREALERARREAEQKARDAAIEKAKREAAEKLRQAQAEAVEKANAQQRAQAAAAAVQPKSAAAIGAGKPADVSPAPVGRTRSLALPVAGAVAAIVVGIGAYLMFGRTPAPAPVVVETPAAPGIDKARQEAEERARRERAEKAVAEKAAAELATAKEAAAERAAAEKAAAERAVAEAAAAKAATEKAAALKAAAERAAAEQAAAEKLALERAAADRDAAAKAAAAKAAAEKAAAEKAAADKAAAERLAAAKAGWPSVGDRWVYEARESRRPARKTTITVVAQAVSFSNVRESVMPGTGEAATLIHGSDPVLTSVAPGVAMFAPYLRAFQELRGDERWSNVDYVVLWDCVGNTYCGASARTIGRERVTVPAGTFDAWRIVVDLKVRMGDEGGTVELTYWYSDSAKRFVKYHSRNNVRSPFSFKSWAQPDVDMELVSYIPAGTR